MSLGDALAYFCFGGVLIALIWLAFMVKRRLDDQAEAQRIADAAFEAQVLRSALPAAEQRVSYVATDTPGSGHMASALLDDMPIPAAEPVMRPIQATPAGLLSPNEDIYRQPADVACAAVIQQMQDAGMVDTVDGFLELNGNPKGAVVLRLKGGKHALVVPYLESEPFVFRNLRRYDMLVQVGKNGKAMVLKSLEETIAAKLAGSMM
jgi:hypothetical protein